MKTFEEKFTAWIDGKLNGDELRDFEAELGRMPDAEAEKNATLQLGELLRAEYRAPELKNADFFNHQIIQRIEADAPRKKIAAEPGGAFSFFTLGRMALAGALSLAVAVVLFIFVIKPAPRSNPTPKDLLAQVLDVNTDDPDVTATSFQSKSQKVTVLWLDGLDYIPDEPK